MFCKHCGKEIADNSRFCPYCGEPVKQQVPDTSGGLPGEENISKRMSDEEPWMAGRYPTENASMPTGEPVKKQIIKVIPTMLTILAVTLLLVAILFLVNRNGVGSQAGKSHGTTQNAASKEKKEEPKSEEEQACEFLDQVVADLKAKKYDEAISHYSRKAMENSWVMQLAGVAGMDAESYIRINWVNLDMSDIKVINAKYGTELPFWDYVIGYNCKNENGAKVYSETTLYAFREDGEWVFCDKSSFDPSYIDGNESQDTQEEESSGDSEQTGDDVQVGNVQAEEGRPTEVDDSPQTQEPVVYASGSTAYNDMTFTVTQTGDTGFNLTVENNTASAYSFGWVSGSTVTLTTTDGTYYTVLDEMPIKDGKISAGSTYSHDAYFENCSGEWQSISIDSVQQLSSSGLPNPGSNGATVTIDLSNQA